MFEYIRGTISEKKTTFVVLDVGGVGYHITIPISTYDRLGDIGSTGKLYIHFHVRENEQRFFGFSTKEEREVFESLLKVAGIGPKIAISILSGITIKDLFEVVARQDVKVLSTVPGIGKKSSERIIVELKDKFEDMLPCTMIEFSTTTPEEQTMINDAETALISLGYHKSSVIKEIQKFLSSHSPSSAEEIVKNVIKKFYSRS
ncbi:MAG TPA: Holliday junction branch migration protein RuvA [Candidatus Cloacimonetes bacterium]|nr:Holliday junction branch migration protein RuvA [Candidatus Cloacimonadota bacterium]HEX37408.1 Holliday junction branch migration protein RuvA [Candidatus Cloacimonadota bacterium]